MSELIQEMSGRLDMVIGELQNELEYNPRSFFGIPFYLDTIQQIVVSVGTLLVGLFLSWLQGKF